MNKNRQKETVPLQGRCVLVTGGTQRLGLEISRHLRSLGAKLIVQSRCTSGAATTVATELGAKTVCFELSDVSAIRLALHETGDKLTDIVWCAASFEQVAFGQTAVEQWDEIFAVNSRSAFFAAQAAQELCPKLETFTLFSDAWGRTLGAKGLAHGLSKALVEPMTIALARIMAPHTRVNAIRPGPVLPALAASEADNRASIANTLTGHWGEPIEIARTVELLLRNRSMTASVITVDGGRSALAPAQLT